MHGKACRRPQQRSRLRFIVFSIEIATVIICATAKIYSNGAMAEWSKAVDLSPSRTDSTGEIRVGSNPTGTITFCSRAIVLIFCPNFIERTGEKGLFND